MSFESLGLMPELSHAVREKGYSKPTPIQKQAIPIILEGRDIMGGAQTGTGKTAGFTLPLLHNLISNANSKAKKRRVRALILVPTRELVNQVADSVRAYGMKLPIRTAVIYGGVSINPQINRLRKGVDIVVATPGRLLDHVQQKTINLSNIEVLVLDEADRMLDMGFIHDIKKILSLLPDRKQTLMFSATFSSEVKRLSKSLLKSPALVEVARQNTVAETVNQIVHPVDNSQKRKLLSFLIGSKNWKQVLVFVRTKRGADRLAERLNKDGLQTAAIHGDKKQGARTKILEKFKSGKMRVLVATDIAARGLDISHLPHVVNYDLPSVAEDYIHRIGRTGRAGMKGDAISLVCMEEMNILDDIERLIKCKIKQEKVKGYEPDPSITRPVKLKPRRNSNSSSSRSRRRRIRKAA